MRHRLFKKDMRSLYRAEKFIEKKGPICHSSTVTEIATSPTPKDNLVANTWCVVAEVDFENWRIGGNQLTLDVLKAFTMKMMGLE